LDTSKPKLKPSSSERININFTIDNKQDASSSQLPSIMKGMSLREERSAQISDSSLKLMESKKSQFSLGKGSHRDFHGEEDDGNLCGV